MSQITLDTDKVWDIGKASEATQKRITELSEGLQSQVKGLSHIEDFIQVYDERIERQIRRMKNEAQRCGMAASYIFKIAENYERTDSGLKKGLSIFAPVLDKTRVENDAAYKMVSTLTDQEKYEKASGIEYSRQNGDEAKTINYTALVDYNGNPCNAPRKTAYDSACGAYSLLHSLRFLDKDKKISIQELCKISVDSKARYDGGTNIIKLIKSLNDRGYNISYENHKYGPTQADLESLQEGKAIICSFYNNTIYNGNYRSDASHFVSIVALSDDKTHVLVIDSMSGSKSFWDGKEFSDPKARDGIYWMPISVLREARSSLVLG